MSSSKFRMMGQESMRKKSKTLRGPNSCLMMKWNFRKKKHFNCFSCRAFRPVKAFPTFQEEELGWMRSVRTSNPSVGRFSSRVNWVKARPFRLNCRSPWRSSKGCWFRLKTRSSPFPYCLFWKPSNPSDISTRPFKNKGR